MKGAVKLVGGDPVLTVERFTLACGLEVLVHPDASTPLVAVSVWYRVGSSDEVPGATGLAHLFEHLFKNSLHLQGRHHYEVLRRAGAVDANASTSADRTAYHEIVPATQLELALWIESDRMGYFLPGLSKERCAAQQAVVLNERRQRYENVPYGAERFAIAEALYPEGHPHRHLTIGRAEDIAAATWDTIADFYRTWYVPANATLVIAGDVTVARARKLAEKWFGSFPAGKRPRRRKPIAVTPGLVRRTVDDRFAAIRRIHRVWASPRAYGKGDAELDVLASILGAPGTGVLWKALVYDRPWAQRVSVYQSSTRLGGELHVVVDLRAAADPAKVRALLDDVIARARDGAIAEPRAVTRVKTRREAGFLWRLEGLGRRVASLQRYLHHLDDPHGLAVDLARYRAITPAAVTRAAAVLDPAAMVEVETRALRAYDPSMRTPAEEPEELS